MVKIGERYYNLVIVRKSNRNIYLRVKGDTLEVTCPRRVSNEEILRFIYEKSKWIEKTVTKTSVKNETSKLAIGNTIYYLGKKYELLVLNGRSDLKIEEDRVVIHCKDGTIDNAIKVFYKESKKKLLELIDEIEPKYLGILEDYGYDLKQKCLTGFYLDYLAMLVGTAYRCKYRGKSGWNCLWLLVPVISFIYPIYNCIKK